jgi:hypothetical protein
MIRELSANLFNKTLLTNDFSIMAYHSVRISYYFQLYVSIYMKHRMEFYAYETSVGYLGYHMII